MFHIDKVNLTDVVYQPSALWGLSCAWEFGPPGVQEEECPHLVGAGVRNAERETRLRGDEDSVFA